MKTALVLLLLFVGGITAIFFGFARPPSPVAGRDVIAAQIQKESNGRITLIDFKKTNGVEGETLGIKYYSLEFTATIAFTADCKWIVGLGGSQIGFRTNGETGNSKMSGFLEDAMNPGVRVKNGQRATVVGNIVFARKERGWALDSIRLTNANITPAQAKAELVGEVVQSPASAPQQNEEPRAKLDDSRLVGLWLRTSPSSERELRCIQTDAVPDIWCFKPDHTIGYGPNGDMQCSVYVYEPVRPKPPARWKITPEGRVRWTGGINEMESDVIVTIADDAMKWIDTGNFTSQEWDELVRTRRHPSELRFTRLRAVTPEMVAKVKAGIEGRAIVGNLMRLATDTEQFCLMNGFDRVTYAQLTNRNGKDQSGRDLLGTIAPIKPVAGEDYGAVRLRENVPLQVKTADGRVFTYEHRWMK